MATTFYLAHLKLFNEGMPMDPNEILGIFRLDKQEYLELILDGKLRFTPIEKYKVTEDEESHRNDSMEGLKRVRTNALRSVPKGDH